MKLSVATVAVWVATAVSASPGEDVVRRMMNEKETRSRQPHGNNDESAVRPIQQELKEQYEETIATEGSPTASPSLASSESPGPSDLPSLSPSIVPSLGPSEIVLPGDFDAGAFPSLAPSSSPAPSDYPSLLPSEVASELPSFVSDELLNADLLPPDDGIEGRGPGVPFCLVTWIEFITCATIPNCILCDRSSPGLVASNECSRFESWRDTNENCCENNECGERLDAFVSCKECGEASSDAPSLAPSEMPSIELLGTEDLEEFPTLSPSASPGPSDLPSLVPSTIESDAPSMLPSDVPSFIPSVLPSGEDDIIGATGDFPTLGPSASPQPSSESDVPSLIPSDLPSLEGIDAEPLAINGRGQVNEEAMPGDDPVVDMGNTNEQIIEEPLPSEDPVAVVGTSEPPSTSLSSSDRPLSIVEELDPRNDPIEGGRDNITCDLDATIECETTDEKPCLFSHVPPEDAMCQDSPTMLKWIYKGGDCGNATTDPSVMCEDLVDGWYTSASTVYIEIHGEEADELYYKGFASPPQTGSLDSIIRLNRTFSAPMENLFVHIKSSNDEDSELLQILAFPRACHAQEGLVIGNQYGALQFGSYKTNSKTVHGFKNVKWTFAATSEVGHELTIKTATAVVSGMEKTFSSGAPLGPGEEASFVCHETISLAEPDMFFGAVTVIGEGADLRECAATAASYIEV